MGRRREPLSSMFPLAIRRGGGGGVSGPAASLADAAVYYKFEETVGAFTDASGNGLSIDRGSAGTSTGHNGNCLYTDPGVQISRASAAGLQVSGDFTLSVWVCPT